MGRIEWIPIAELPEAFKDGREVLFYYPDAFAYDPDSPVPTMAVKRCDSRGNWSGYYPVEFLGEPTHFAELNPPE